MNHKPVIIVGAGGHAKVVVDALKLLDREILGFTTPDLQVGTEFLGIKVLGDDSIINKYSPDEVELANGIGALPRKNLRWKLASELRELGYNFLTIIHPNAVIAPGVSLDEGVQVMAGVVLQPGTAVGRDSIINTGVLLDHDCTIEVNCHLATGVICSGGVEVGRNTHLGTGAIVTEYISIGKKSIVAAGSIVYQNIGDNTQLIQKRGKTVTKIRENNN